MYRVPQYAQRNTLVDMVIVARALDFLVCRLYRRPVPPRTNLMECF